MATSSNEIERIVRKVLNEEQDETIDAIRELSTLLTEQVIPRLSKGDGDVPEADEDEDIDSDPDAEADEGAAMSTSGFGDEDEPRAGRRAGANGSDGDDENEETDLPGQDIPPPVMEAFTTLYSSLSSGQASALAELFTTINSELDVDAHADEEHDDDDVRARA